jgi:hypothetical protein
MDHTTAEKVVKGLQKDFLLWIEETPKLSTLTDDQFTTLRRRVFRSTFQAFRLGIIGIDPDDDGLLPLFTDWLHDVKLDDSYAWEITNRCFMTALSAFRIGACVAAMQEVEDALLDG